MNFYKKIWVVACVLFISSVGVANNLITNGDFEIVSTKKNFPLRWNIVRKGGCIYSKDTGKTGGEHCLLFDLQGKLTRIESSLRLKKGRKYRLTVDVKTENHKGSSGIYITPPRWNWGEIFAIPQGSNDWKKYSFVYSIPEQERSYRFILLSKKNSQGKIWFNNLSLEEVVPEVQNTAFISAGLIKEKPVIDGNLDDACWDNTLEATPFEKIGKYKFSTFAPEQTGVKIAYDSKNIYFGFTCHQRCLEPFRNSLDDFRDDVKKHDGEMWKQDCVLLLLKTGKNDSFYEIIVNGAGTITDASCRGPNYWTIGRSISWESNARAAVTVSNGKWTAEIAIPLKKLNLSSTIGTTFKACLGRLNISSNKSGSVYFPMQRGFHTPKYFGSIKLGAKIPKIFDLTIGSLTPGKNKLKFKAASSNRELKLNINTMDATTRKSFSNKLFQLTPAAQEYSAEYTCTGKDYSFMYFTLQNKSGVFWKSPSYSKQNNSQSINLQFDGKKNMEVMLNKFTMSRESDSKKTNYTMLCRPGLYNTKGIIDKFTLSTSGFTTPVISNSKNMKIMVGTTKFWPETNNNLYIAENSIQPLHVVLHNPYKELKSSSYSFNLAVPEEFKLTGSTASSKAYINLQTDKMPTITCNGKTFKHFKITIPGGLTYKAFYRELDAVTILLDLPKSGKSFKTRQAEFYAWSEFDNNSTIEVPQKINVNILPPLKGQVPKHFITQIWGGRMVNLNNRKLARKFIRETIFGSGFNDLQSGSSLIGDLKMTSFAVLNLRWAWGKELDKMLEKYSEYTLVDSLGKQAAKGAYNRMCSTILLENKNVHEIMFQTIVQKYKPNAYINVDWECSVETGPISCYCERCLKRFKKSVNIPQSEKLDSKKIHKKYRKQWMHFMHKKLALLIGIIKNKVHKMGSKLTFYSGYQSDKTLEHYGVDWNLIAPNIDYALAGYRTSVEIIKRTIKILGETPLLSGVVSSPCRMISRESPKQIDKAFIIKGIVLGSKGYLCYNIPQLDGRSYYAFSETTAMLSKYEDIIYFGEINNKWLTVKGVNEGHYALFEKAESKKKILIIYNEDFKKSLNFKVKLKGDYKVYDYFAKKDILTSKQSFEATIAPQDFKTYCIEEN